MVFYLNKINMDECVSCLDDIEIPNYYRDGPERDWKPCPYCEICIDWFVQNQWDTYVNTIKNETCKKTVKRLIKKGPPTHVSDPQSLPCDNPRESVWEFKIGSDIKSAELVGCLKGTEMEKYKAELNLYLKQIETEISDSDSEESNEK